MSKCKGAPPVDPNAMRANLVSRSEMRRLAVQNPDALIEEIELLRARIETFQLNVDNYRRENDRLRARVGQLENDCEERDAATVKLFNDNARLRAENEKLSNSLVPLCQHERHQIVRFEEEKEKNPDLRFDPDSCGASDDKNARQEKIFSEEKTQGQ